MRRVLVVVAVAATLAACQDGPVTSPERVLTGTSIRTANSSWLDHFYFLPPLGPSPTPTGGFNPEAAVAIRIDRCAANLPADNCTVVQTVAEFTRTGAAGTGVISVSTVDEHYSAQWNTTVALADAKYRVRALSSLASGAVQYGYVDLQVYAQANDANNAVAENPASVAVNKGSNVQIKMRIEDGLFCQDVPTCGEGFFNHTGDRIIYSGDGFAAIKIPAGFVDENGIDYALTITRHTDANVPCLPINHPQYEGCYRFVVEPSLALTSAQQRALYEAATVNICLDAAVDTSEAQLWKWDEVSVASLEALPKASPPDEFVDCEGFAPTPGAQQFGSLSRWLRPLARLLTPAPLHARRGGTPPLSGKLIDFSRIGAVRELELTKIPSSDNQTAVAGQAVNVNPTVKVTSKLKPNVVVPGVTVNFAAQNGGSVIPVTTTTGPLGLASTVWTLGGSLGGQTMTASAFNPRTPWPNVPPNFNLPTANPNLLAGFQYGPWGTVTFNATAVAQPPYQALFMSPLGSASGSKDNLWSLTPKVDVCHVNGAQCDLFVTLVTEFQLATNKQSFQINWSTPSDLRIGDYYRIRVLIGNVAIGSVTLRAVASGSKASKEPFTFEVGRTLPIKFVILAQ